MGTFGEAIYGHVGQYKACVYNAQTTVSGDGTGRFVNARGLSENDAVNTLFGGVSIGPQNDSAMVLSLDAELKGYSWALRVAPQSGSAVSRGFCHAVHMQSTLSSLYQIDQLIYFPFIPNGEYCVSLIRNPQHFNAAERWEGNMRSVPVIRERYNQGLGKPLNIPDSLMKLLTAYIISKVSVNAKQYLYIRVPDRAPYEPYCLAALHDILTHIPAGMRAGISAATNPSPQEEHKYGIIFQRASYPVRHSTDINLHQNADYPFLRQVYISPSLHGLLNQMVDYPGFTDKCYRTLEQEVFGDKIPNSYQSYENYFGISAIQKEQMRPSYLEECNNLLNTTTEPSLKAILERIIMDEFRVSADLEGAIRRDPLFARVHTFADLTGYLQARKSILAFLEAHGIRYSAMFLYGHLSTIARGAGVTNAIDFYDKIVTEQQDLSGLSRDERDRILADSHRSAWDYFGRMCHGPQQSWDEQTGYAQFSRLVNLDQKAGPGLQAPISEKNWYNGSRRRALLEQFRQNIQKESVIQLLSIPDYRDPDGTPVYETAEREELLSFIQEIMEARMNQKTDPNTARSQIDELMMIASALSEGYARFGAVFGDGFGQEDTLRAFYERALYSKALDYTGGEDVSGNQLGFVLQLARSQMPVLGERCIQDVEVSIAERIRNRQLNPNQMMELYRTAAVSRIDSELQQAYEGWVSSELQQNTLEAAQLTELYQSVRGPGEQLRALYQQWCDHTARKEELIEKMKASRTLVKYLNTLLTAKGDLYNQEMKDGRSAMWRKLTMQERTISAYTASVAYLFDAAPEPALLANKDRRSADTLQKECRILVQDYRMGLYLDPNLSLAELYDNVRQYIQWCGEERIWLYTDNEVESKQKVVIEEPDGTSAYGISVETEDVLDTLRLLLVLLDGADYKTPGGRQVNPDEIRNELTRKNKTKIIKALADAGLVRNNPDLAARLQRMGYLVSNPGGGRDTFDFIKIALAAGILILTFLLGGLIVPRVAAFFRGREEVVTAPPEPGTEVPGGGADTSQPAADEPTPAEENPDTGNTGNTGGENKEEKGGSENTNSTEDKNQQGTGNGVEGTKLPLFEDYGEDGDLKLAMEVRNRVAEDNKIEIKKKDHVLLPGEWEQGEDTEGPFLAVKYYYWTFKKDELKLDNPSKKTYAGFIRLRRDTENGGQLVYAESTVLLDKYDKTEKLIKQFESSLNKNGGTLTQEKQDALTKLHEHRDDPEAVPVFTVFMRRYAANSNRENELIKKIEFNGKDIMSTDAGASEDGPADAEESIPAGDQNAETVGTQVQTPAEGQEEVPGNIPANTQ